MRFSRSLSFAMVLAAASSATACAPMYRNTVWTSPAPAPDRDYDRDGSNRTAYQDGWRQGRFDAEHRLNARPYESRWRSNDDRHAYYDGYTRAYRNINGGYRDNDRDHDWDRDRDRDRDRD